MPEQTSQTTPTVLKSVEKSEFLITSARNARPAAAENLAEVYGRFIVPGGGSDGAAPEAGDAVATGSQVSSMLKVHDDTLQLLEGSMADVRVKDQKYRVTRAKAKAKSQELPDRIDALGRHYSDMRLLVEGTYGPEYLHVMGLDGAQAEGSIAVREQLKESGERMQDPVQVAQMPGPRKGRTALDFQSMGATTQELVEGFESYRAEVKDLRKTIKKLALDRRQALRQHRRIYANVGRIVEGILRLAGLDDLARQLRFKKPSRSSKPESPPAPDTDASPPAAEPGSGEEPAPADGATEGKDA